MVTGDGLYLIANPPGMTVIPSQQKQNGGSVDNLGGGLGFSGSLAGKRIQMNLPEWMRRRRPQNVYYGWWVVAASSAMIFFASGIFFRGFSVFFVPVRNALELKDWQTSLVFSLARGGGGVEGPIAGWMVDHIGVRKMAMPAILLAGLGYFALFKVDSFLTFSLVYLGVISMTNSLAFEHAIFSGLNMWFIRRRAMALSLYTASAALGGVALIPVMNLLIIHLDWRWAAVIAGCAYLVFVLPLTYFLRPSPESMGLQPDGDPVHGAGTALGISGPAGHRSPSMVSTDDPRDFGVREALSTSGFWFLLLGIALRNWARNGMLVNLQPILLWKGATREAVGYLISMNLAVNVVSRLLVGLVTSRSMSRVLVTLVALDTFAILFLITGSWESSAWAIFVYIGLSGFGDAVGVLSWTTLGDFYGRRRYATLRGIIKFSSSWVIVAAPTFVGWWADRTGGYTLPLWLSVVFLGMAALSFSMIRKPQRPLVDPTSRTLDGQPL